METVDVFSTMVTNWTTIVDGVISIIEGNALMAAMISLPLIGGGIGLIKRLI